MDIRRGLLIGLFGTCFSISWLVAILSIIAAFRGTFRTVDPYACYVFFVAFAILIFLRHFFYEAGLWRRKELVWPTVFPVGLIALAVISSLRVELLLILLPVFAIFGLAAVVFNPRLADRLNDLVFPLAGTGIISTPLVIGNFGGIAENFSAHLVDFDENLDFEEGEDFSEEDFDENAVQQWTRTLSADVGDLLSGWVRFDFVTGQRSGNIHLPFSPAFSAIPDIEIHQIDGPEVKISVAQLMPYGARLDLKRTEATNPEAVRIHITASDPAEF